MKKPARRGTTIAHIGIAVRGLDPVLSFYRDILGAALKIDPSAAVRAIVDEVLAFEMPGAGIEPARLLRDPGFLVAPKCKWDGRPQLSLRRTRSLPRLSPRYRRAIAPGAASNPSRISSR